MRITWFFGWTWMEGDTYSDRVYDKSILRIIQTVTDDAIISKVKVRCGEYDNRGTRRRILFKFDVVFKLSRTNIREFSVSPKYIIIYV